MLSEFSLNDLLSHERADILLLVGPRSVGRVLHYRLLNGETNHTFRIIRGAKCLDREGLFQEWGAALQFPLYFGENMDALEDCLTDLHMEFRGDGYIVFVTDSESILPNSDRDFGILVDILCDLARFYREGSPPGQVPPVEPTFVKIILQVPHDRYPEFQERIVNTPLAAAPVFEWTEEI